MGMRVKVFKDLLKMGKRSKRWWLTPMMVLMVMLGVALAGLQAVEYLSPFIYAVLRSPGRWRPWSGWCCAA